MSEHSLLNVNMQILIIQYSELHTGFIETPLTLCVFIQKYYPKTFCILHDTAGIRHIDINFSHCPLLQLMEVPISIAYEPVNCCQCLFVGAFESMLVLGRHCC